MGVKKASLAFFLLIIAGVSNLFADAKLVGLVKEKKYTEAINYAESSLPAAKRTADEAAMVADVYAKAGKENKALATYMLMARIYSKDSRGYIGASNIYYNQKKYTLAEAYGKKAFAAKQSGEAAWQYARAALALKKNGEAKKALETVIASDAGNVVANSALAQIYYDNKEYNKAVNLLIKAYSTKADGKLAVQIARSYKAIGNDADAIKYYAIFMKSGKTDKKAILEYAEVLNNNKRYGDAAKYYLKAEGKVPFNGDTYMDWAEALESSAGADKALAIYKKANKKYGTNKGKRALKACLIVADANKKSSFAAAAKGYQFYLSADSKSKKASGVLISLANVQVAQKQVKPAITSLEKAIAIDPNSVDAYATLAELYAKTGQKEKSEKTLETLIGKNASDPVVYLKLALFKYNNKQYNEAVKHFKKSNTLKASFKAQKGLALSYGQLKMWTEALPVAKSALDSKFDLDVQKVYAEALVSTGDATNSVGAVQKVLAKQKNNLKFWKLLLKAAQKSGNNGALAASDSAITILDKKDIESRERYAESKRESKEFKVALKHYSELVALKPGNTSYLKIKYELESELGLTDSAIKTLNKYLVKKPTDIKLTMAMGELYFSKKANDNALKYYRAALKLNPQPAGFPYENYASVVLAKGLDNEVITALTGVIEAGKAKAVTYTTLGMIYKQKKKYSKAIEMYNQALIMDPENDDALIALGDCQLASGDAMMATVTYEQVVMMNPKLVDVYRKLGNAYLKSGDKSSGMKNYEVYLEKGGKDSKIALKIGNAKFAKKDYKGAASAYSVVKGESAKSYAYQLNYAKSLYRSKQYKTAIIWQKKLLKRNPKTTTKKNIMKELGISKVMIGDTAGALVVFNSFKKLQMKDKDVFYQRGKLNEKKNPSLAIKIYQGNMKVYPSDMRNHLALGLLYSKSDDEVLLKKSAALLTKVEKNAGNADPELLLTIAKAYGKAYDTEKELATYNKYIEKKPDDVDAYVRIGEIDVMKGDFDDAVIKLEMASALDPKRKDLQLLLAESYTGLSKYSDAITILNKLQKQEPDDVEILKLLIDANVKSGNRDAARSMLEKLVKKANDRDYNFMYVNFLIEEKNYKEATKFVDKALDVYAEDLDALVLKARIMRAQGDVAGAAGLLRQVVATDPYNAVAAFELAKSYETLGGAKKRMAMSYYAKAVKNDPTMGEAWYKKALLHKLYKQMPLYKEAIGKAVKLLPGNPAVVKEAKSAGL